MIPYALCPMLYAQFPGRAAVRSTNWSDRELIQCRLKVGAGPSSKM